MALGKDYAEASSVMNRPLKRLVSKGLVEKNKKRKGLYRIKD